jgi:hypothetical protein
MRKRYFCFRTLVYTVIVSVLAAIPAGSMADNGYEEPKNSYLHAMLEGSKNFLTGMNVEDFWESEDLYLGSYDPGFNISVDVDAMTSNNHLVVQSQAGFNNAGFGELKNYLSASRSVSVENYNEQEDYLFGSSYTSCIYAFTIDAPEGFWDDYDYYYMNHSFNVSGVINKTSSSYLDLYVSTFRHIDDSGGEEWSFYNDEEFLGEFNNLEFSQTFGKTWLIDPEDPAYMDMPVGEFTLGHSIDIDAGAISGDAFSVTADFFNTTELGTISILTQNGSEDLALVATFDNQGNVIAGDTGFSISTRVIPEPATMAMLALGAAVILKRRQS